MARSGTSSGLAGPVVPEVNISKNGASPSCMTGAHSVDCCSSCSWKFRSPARCSAAAATQRIGGQALTSSSLLRLTLSVTTSLAPELLRRYSMALGPNAVNKG
ncbi:hypothetical protein D9M73_218250 [compost metagenome]